MFQRTAQAASTVISQDTAGSNSPLHTPTPWDAGGDCIEDETGEGKTFSAGDVYIFPPTGSCGPVAIVAGSANAAFIVKAVNSHDAMVKALEQIAQGTADAEPPFRAMGREQMAQLAREALRTINQPA